MAAFGGSLGFFKAMGGPKSLLRLVVFLLEHEGGLNIVFIHILDHEGVWRTIGEPSCPSVSMFLRVGFIGHGCSLSTAFVRVLGHEVAREVCEEMSGVGWASFLRASILEWVFLSTRVVGMLHLCMF